MQSSVIEVNEMFICYCQAAFSICGSSSPPNQLVNFVDLPERAKEGDRVTLICKYDARGSRLHQVRWFLNNEEFVSFLPSRNRNAA
jgi:hypothetical protein